MVLLNTKPLFLAWHTDYPGWRLQAGNGQVLSVTCWWLEISFPSIVIGTWKEPTE